MPKIGLNAIENTIANLNAAGPCGPRTTFPRNADDSPGHSAEVTILCDRERWDDVVRWLNAMTHDVPKLIARIRELETHVGAVAEALEAVSALATRKPPELYVSMAVRDLRALVDGPVTP